MSIYSMTLATSEICTQKSDIVFKGMCTLLPRHEHLNVYNFGLLCAVEGVNYKQEEKDFLAFSIKED